MERKVIDYKMAVGEGSIDLAKAVCALLKEGFEPFGSPLTNEPYRLIYQAMVKYEDSSTSRKLSK